MTATGGQFLLQAADGAPKRCCEQCWIGAIAFKAKLLQQVCGKKVFARCCCSQIG